MNLKISVIINTIRRPKELVEKSLKAALSQSGITEVILVDQNNPALALSPGIAEHAKLRIQNCVVPAVSQARNAARYAPDTDWIIFCDDDGYLADGYCAALLQQIAKHPETDIFAGSILRTDNHRFYTRRQAVGGNLNYFFFTKLLMGSNFAVKRTVFEALNKFDPEFGAGAKYGSSEETDFAWNAHFSRKNMRFSPELIVFHPPPFQGDLDSEIAKAYRYGEGKGALVAKWLFRKRKWVVLIELVEMLLFPKIKILFSILTLRSNSTRLQWASLMGRWDGLGKLF